MPAQAPGEKYSRAEVRRILGISEQQLLGWERQGLIPTAREYSFSDLIALRTLKELRQKRVSSRLIGRALASLRSKLAEVPDPLKALKMWRVGKRIAVQVDGQRMEAISGQLLIDFEPAEIDNLRSFPRETNQESARRRKEADFWFEKGLDLEESGAPVKQVMEAYEKALELCQVAVGALVNLGTVHFQLRQFAEAETYYRRAVEADPGYALAHFNLGNLYDEQNDLERAYRHYVMALQLNPQYADAHYNMALLCERKGDLLTATRHWKVYLKIDPTSEWAAIAHRQLERLRKETVIESR